MHEPQTLAFLQNTHSGAGGVHFPKAQQAELVGKCQSPDKELRARFYFNSALPFGTTGHNAHLPWSGFWKGERFLGMPCHWGVSPSREASETPGQGKLQIPWTSAFQRLPPDQVWAFALSLPKYMRLLPTMSALSLSNRKDMSHNLFEGTEGHPVQHSTHSPQGLEAGSST